ncbi:hypothetical protein RhiJN_06602 [Ceratobasidium sp. AG-Ba]|nr:hypothetical protein RhiJN_06602 [Ceratobasidium sp. AG-Ba]
MSPLYLPIRMVMSDIKEDIASSSIISNRPVQTGLKLGALIVRESIKTPSTGCQPFSGSNLNKLLLCPRKTEQQQNNNSTDSPVAPNPPTIAGVNESGPTMVHAGLLASLYGLSAKVEPTETLPLQTEDNRRDPATVQLNLRTNADPDHFTITPISNTEGMSSSVLPQGNTTRQGLLGLSCPTEMDCLARLSLTHPTTDRLLPLQRPRSTEGLPPEMIDHRYT